MPWRKCDADCPQRARATAWILVGDKLVDLAFCRHHRNKYRHGLDTIAVKVEDEPDTDP